MAVFGVMLLIYAALLATSKDAKMIRKSYAAKMPDPKLYARQFAKVIGLVSASFFVSAAVGLFFNAVISFVVFIVLFVLVLIIGAKIIKVAQ